MVRQALVLPRAVHIVQGQRIALDVFQGVGENRTGGRSRQPIAIRVQPLDHVAQGGQVGMIVAQRPFRPGLQLVAAAPNGQRRMVSLAPHDHGRFVPQPGDEIRVCRRLVVDAGAGLDKLLPDEDAQPVTGIVKAFFFDEAAAPYPQHVDVGPLGQGEQPLQFLRPFHPIEHIHRRPVPAVDIDLAAIDDECVRSRLPLRSLIGHKVNVADAERLGAQHGLA
jgi:hypothetical protein